MSPRKPTCLESGTFVCTITGIAKNCATGLAVSVLFLHTLCSQQSSVPLFKPLVEAGSQNDNAV
jgi:hypothetical protein